MGAPQHVNHWCRVVMNRDTTERVARLDPQQLDALEISGSAWNTMGFRTYRNVGYPQFDICKQIVAHDAFDIVIAEQVFEHLEDPMAAAKNILQMLRHGGTFLVTTPFMIKSHPSPLDLWRWSAQGMMVFLQRAGFKSVEAFSWGNRACVVGNFEQWPIYNPAMHSLANEPDFPMVVWALAKRG